MRNLEFKRLVVSAFLSVIASVSLGLAAPVSFAQSDDVASDGQPVSERGSDETKSSGDAEDTSSKPEDSGTSSDASNSDKSSTPDEPAKSEEASEPSAAPDEPKAADSKPDATTPAKTEEAAATAAPEVPTTAASPGPAATTAAPVGQAPLIPDKRGADYYDRRAGELLKNDHNRDVIKDHPLASAYPNQFIVVCEAGCPNEAGAEIVSMKPHAGASIIADPNSKQASALMCVGGCPDGPQNYASGVASTGTQVAAGQIGEWMTTVAKLPAGAAAPKAASTVANGSGEWMVRINKDQAPPALVTTPVTQSKPAAAVPAAPKAPEAAKPEAKVDAPVPAATVEAKPPPAAAAMEKSLEAPKSAVAALAAGDSKTSAVPPAAVSKPADAAAVTDAKPPMTTAADGTSVTTPVSIVNAAEAKPASAVKPATDMATTGTAKPAPAAADAKTTPEVKPMTAAEKAAEMADTAGKMRVAELTNPATEFTQPAAPAKDKVMSVSSEDAAMNAAVTKARDTLAQFWSSYDKPAAGEADFALKVAITDENGTEHFWLTKITKGGDKLSGVISNNPQSVKSVKSGQTYDFTAGAISDWTFKRNGKLVGNETMRALLPRMPAQQAAQYKAMYETP